MANNDKWIENIMAEVERREAEAQEVPPVIAGYYLADGIYFDMSVINDDDDWN